MAGVQGLAGGEEVQGPHHHEHGEQGKHQRFSRTKRKVKLGLGAGTAASTLGLSAAAEHSNAAGVPTSVRTRVNACALGCARV
jgi:ribose 5-phosphate isomerase